MLLSLKRRRILSERREAVSQRDSAARDLVAALREAEAAVEALKAANDRFYRAEDQPTQAILNQLRRDRERMFAFHTAAEAIAEAPVLARILGVRIGTATRYMPLVEWINHVSTQDLGAAGDDLAKGA